MTPRLSLARRLLHWAVAILVIFMIPGGLFFTNFDNRPWIEATFGFGSFNAFYDLHKAVGILVLALMALRVAALFVWPAPAYAPKLPLPERLAARAAHGTLYLLLFVVPALGYLGVITFPAPVPVFGLFEVPAILAPDRELSGVLLGWHSVGAWVVTAIVTIHVCAALWHRNVKQDGVFDRIALMRRRSGAGK